jgi:hypothetical protein
VEVNFGRGYSSQRTEMPQKEKERKEKKERNWMTKDSAPNDRIP